MRPRVVLVTWIVAAVGAALLAVPEARSTLSSLGGSGRALAAGQDASPAAHAIQVAAQPPPPPPTLRAPESATSVKGPASASFFSWAFLDRKTGTLTGSANSAAGTNSTESMVKAWITGDYLRRQEQAGQTPSNGILAELTLMIIDSNDNMAQKYYEIGGSNTLMQRMISMCGLSHTKIFPYWWAKTQMSPQDAVKYGLCVANGTAAGAKWTPWLLETMKHVRGGVNDQISVTRQGGHWGIIDGLPPELAGTVSIKNGWTAYGDGWHVNCLAIQQDWILSVMVRIGGLQSAANACRSVAQQLIYHPDL